MKGIRVQRAHLVGQGGEVVGADGGVVVVDLVDAEAGVGRRGIDGGVTGVGLNVVRARRGEGGASDQGSRDSGTGASG